MVAVKTGVVDLADCTLRGNTSRSLIRHSACGVDCVAPCILFGMLSVSVRQSHIPADSLFFVRYIVYRTGIIAQLLFFYRVGRGWISMFTVPVAIFISARIRWPSFSYKAGASACSRLEALSSLAQSLSSSHHYSLCHPLHPPRLCESNMGLRAISTQYICVVLLLSVVWILSRMVSALYCFWSIYDLRSLVLTVKVFDVYLDGARWSFPSNIIYLSCLYVRLLFTSFLILVSLSFFRSSSRSVSPFALVWLDIRLKKLSAAVPHQSSHSQCIVLQFIFAEEVLVIALVVQEHRTWSLILALTPSILYGVLPIVVRCSCTR